MGHGKEGVVVELPVLTRFPRKVAWIVHWRHEHGDDIYLFNESEDAESAAQQIVTDYAVDMRIEPDIIYIDVGEETDYQCEISTDCKEIKPW